MFITFEGIEGGGKSTHLKSVARMLEKRGISVVTTREPGGTKMGEEIRDILLAHRKESVAPMTELLLMFSARAQHVKTVIQPALANGSWVLCDRFTDATYAYQGGGRGLSLELIQALERLVLEGFKPDHTFIFDIPPEVSFARVKKRGSQDRIEQEKSDFFKRVRAAYQEIALTDNNRYFLIDAKPPLLTVEQTVLAKVNEWL